MDLTPSPAAYSTNMKIGSDTPAWTMRPALPRKRIYIYIYFYVIKMLSLII